MSDAGGMHCRSCGDGSGEIVLDLGRQPSWDRMPWWDTPLPDPVFALQMWFCHTCGLAQLRCDADGNEELLGVEPRSVTEQSDRSLERMADEGVIGPGRTVAEFGSPHGESWLPRLARAGMVPVPAAALPGDGSGGTAGPVTVPGATLAIGSAEPAGGPDRGPADLVVDFYGLLHEPDQESALRRRAASLAPGGTLVVQMLSLGTVLGLHQWFDLRHGHYAYWSLPALDDALGRHGLGVHRAWRYPLSGGTILLTARRDPDPDASTLRLIAEERDAGVVDAAALRTLQDAADRDAATLRGWLTAERDAGRTVAGYGAASRSVPVISHAGLHTGLLTMIGDASPTKQGRRMPGTDVPVVPPDALELAAPDRVLLFLPELADEVRETLPGIEAAGGRWVVSDPSLRVLEPALVR